MAETAIEWASDVWNPTSGCDRVSPGCDHCYALTMAKRLKGMGQAKYQRDGDPRTSGPGFGLTVHKDALTIPLRWKKPRRIFVNSMSDLFHADVPDEFIARVFAVMALAPQHIFQLLTKRHGRMRSLLNAPSFRLLCEATEAELIQNSAIPRHRIDAFQRQWWSDFAEPLQNVWLGVSAEDQHWADIRIPALLETPAAVRWVSAEPILGPIDLSRYVQAAWTCPHCSFRQFAHVGSAFCVRCHERTYPPPYTQLDWVVVGGESGPGARPMEAEWVKDIVRQCCDAWGVSCFVKQMGSVWARQNGADPKGGKTEYWPEDLRVRAYPITDEASSKSLRVASDASPVAGPVQACTGPAAMGEER